MLRDGAEVTTRAARGAAGGDLAADALALSRSVARRALDSGEAILVADAETDERLSAFASVLGQQCSEPVAAKLEASLVVRFAYPVG